MLPDHQYFKLFTNCIPVKGISRSIICDLQRHRLEIIPNTMFEMLKENEGKSIKEIKDIYGKENEQAIIQYFEFLINKEYVFLCDQSDLAFFPPLNMDWEIPSIIENAIIDIDDKSQHDYKTIFNQLDDLICIALHLRFFVNFSIDSFENILTLLNESIIESIDVLIPYNESITEQQLKHWNDTYPRIRSIIISQAPTNFHINNEDWHLTVILTDKKIDSHLYCGMIGPKYFTVNQKLFSESLQFNTCLNHKISIDIDGNIKNCPSMEQSFGNIKNVRLEEAIGNSDFKKYWRINKEQIETCKGCEFRHICTDCRAFLENPQDIYSKPLKCGYDPQTTKWEEWSQNPLKEKSIKYYELEEILVQQKE